MWNRHKDQLRSRSSRATLPLIWAEAVRASEFNFAYQARSEPFFALREGQDHLVFRQRCVLVQRTTAKEQTRRLVACAVPLEFLEEWGGIVVENHVNVLKPLGEHALSPDALAAVLNSRSVDLAFRCLSGSVAVSASELHALPLPGWDVMEEIERSLSQGQEQVDHLVDKAYGVRSGGW